MRIAIRLLDLLQGTSSVKTSHHGCSLSHGPNEPKVNDQLAPSGPSSDISNFRSAENVPPMYASS